jgi:putative membrane-bound dehydrogenase-like protein
MFPSVSIRVSSVAAAFALLWLGEEACGQGYSPAEAPGKMKLPEGFSAKLVASEPLIRQPVAIDFDDRGRLWVMQYLQYPNPAGLERVKVDRFSRTKYDKVPEPPPRGPKGEDRLTIVELGGTPTALSGREGEKNGKENTPTQSRGRATQGPKTKDFLSGLNLASAFQFGHGGVYVLNPPYLLFYADQNRDDVPDGDPEVLLTGFGMDDAHSVANSLTWGPDGWLYGCQGSTVTANIRGIEFQQGVWRYHPRLKEFELFCEGGGNSWGLDFDDDGNLLYSTNHGGFVMLHGVQGAYLWKQFGKHGELHNPHAYGYFDHVPHQNFFGGHVTVGGIVYRGDAYPEKFRDKYIAGDLLGHGVYWHDIEPRGTTFQTKHGGELLVANDTWFATSDVCLGPDGSVYVADWHDKRTAHPDPDADWDRRNGRVYKIEYGGKESGGTPTAWSGRESAKGGDKDTPTQSRGRATQEIPDFAKASSDELIKLLFSKNHWLATRARRILGERQDRNTCAPLEKLVRESKDQHDALKALWALDVSGGFSESLGCELLDHKSPLIRRWVVRLLGDPKKVEPTTAARLRKLAEEEESPLVRSQLASTAKRLPTKDALPIIKNLLSRETGDEKDPYISLLLWWAVEQHAVAAELELPDFLTQGPVAKNPIVKETILPRLVRRYISVGEKDLDEATEEILSKVPQQALLSLLAAMELGMQRRPDGKEKLAPALVTLIQGLDLGPDGILQLRILVKSRDSKAAKRAKPMIFDPKVSEADRISLIGLFGDIAASTGGYEVSDGGGPVELQKLIMNKEPEAIKLATIAEMRKLGTGADDFIKSYVKLTEREKSAARAVMLGSDPDRTLKAVEQGTLSSKDFTMEELRVVAVHNDPMLNKLVRKLWGKIDPPTKEEVLADVRRLNNDLRAFPGDAKNGKTLFTKHCATCHKLFNEGNVVGPDLTFANRTDRDFLLISTVDPSAVVRKEFQSHVALLKNGTVVTGLIVENKPPKMVFVDAKGQKTEVAHSDIDEIKESPTSLMPDNILKQLKPDELRDLFAYLQAAKKPEEDEKALKKSSSHPASFRRSRLNPLPPVTGAAMQVHDGDHQGMIFANLIHKSVRKTMRAADPDVFSQARPSERHLLDAVECLVDLPAEVRPKLRPDVFVMTDCVFQFELGSIQEPSLHDLGFRPRASETSSRERERISPRSYAARRSSASSAQASAISSCCDSRLRSRVSTSFARDSGGRARAAVVMDSVVMMKPYPLADYSMVAGWYPLSL